MPSNLWKKRKIQRRHRHHYNRNQSPNLRHQSKGMTFLEALLPDASNQWPQCGAGLRIRWGSGFTGHVNWYHVLRLFSLFFCFKPRLFCTCLKGLGWFRHLLCKPANHLSRDEILVEFWLAKSDKDDWVHLVLQCVVHIYIYIYPLVI